MKKGKNKKLGDEKGVRTQVIATPSQPIDFY